MAPSKILIVDDEPFNVDYLEQELEDLGYQTLSAGNGKEALDRIAAEPPDLILLDVMMPVMDGFTTCRLLKGRDETRLIPIVIMTALDGIETGSSGSRPAPTTSLQNRQPAGAVARSSLLEAQARRRPYKQLSELHRIKDPSPSSSRAVSDSRREPGAPSGQARA